MYYIDRLLILLFKAALTVLKANEHSFHVLLFASVFCITANENKARGIIVKTVNVSDIEERFNAIAETFNKLHNNRMNITQSESRLRELCGCSPHATLVDSLHHLQQQHGLFYVIMV